MTFPPGPRLYHFPSLLWQFWHNPLSVFTDITARYPDIAYVRLGSYRFYLISDADLAFSILADPNGQFHKSRLFKRPTISFLGDGLLVSEDATWKRQRRLMRPAFHHSRIAAYARLMRDYTLEAAAAWGESIEIDREMMRLTSRIVLRSLFGAEVSGRLAQVAAAVHTIQKVATRQAKFLFPLPLGEGEKRAAIETLDTLLREIITERRRTASDEGDLLSLLLMTCEENGEPMSDRQVRDEMMNLFMAGHDLTANILTWTWYLLAHNPDVEAKLHAELDTVLGGQPPTLDDLLRLTYTEMVIKEAMRLYPPGWLLAREPQQAISVGGYTVPKDSTLFICLYTLHRDPHYFDQPERFYPERFSDERQRALMRHAYMPFGAGPRYCIGSSFAMLEAQMVLATIASRYRLTSNAIVHPKALLTLHPEHRIEMQVETRQTEKMLKRII